MIEKVNPMHPDKIADRIAGALVDSAYQKAENPRIAVEGLIGHRKAFISTETNVHFEKKEVEEIVARIAHINDVTYLEVPQDAFLASNQANIIRCGDNGIFKGCYPTTEQQLLTSIVKDIYEKVKADGKYILDLCDNTLIACQSNITNKSLQDILVEDCYLSPRLYTFIINPLGPWAGGTDVDCGAVNRKLGSDMGHALTGGGLHGKDLSKADVTLNIYCHLKALELKRPYSLYCYIGQEDIDGKPYSEIVEIARQYINAIGGFEKFAEWGLV